MGNACPSMKGMNQITMDAGKIGGMAYQSLSDQNESESIDMFHKAKNRKYCGLKYEQEVKWHGDFQFICMGDPQIGMGNQEKEEEFSRLAVEFINRRKYMIKFVIVCGDHTQNLEDFWSKGDLIQGRHKRIQELKAYKAIWRKLDKSIPLVCVCGNHDVGNNPTQETIKLYTDEFGDDYLTFWCGGVKFFVLNSQIIQGLDDSNSLAVNHENWFSEEIAKSKLVHTPVHSAVMCQIPPFCWDINEDNTNFNWPKEKRKKWLNKMVDANVKRVYCSHYHRRSGGIYKKLEVVVTAPIGTSILTKPTPEIIKRKSLADFNWRLSSESFGGCVTEDSYANLMVVTVTKKGFEEKRMNVSDIRKMN